MTRQKKEILRQIDEIERDIEIDRQLAFGMAPPGAYDRMYQQIDELWDKLARLSHYESPEAMFHDERHMRLNFSLKLQECYDAYLDEWEKLSPGKLIAQAEKIHIAGKLANGLPDMLSYSEMEYLLRFRNPLEVAVETWSGSTFMEIGEEEFREVLFETRERGDLDGAYELTESAAAAKAMEKPKAEPPKRRSQER